MTSERAFLRHILATVAYRGGKAIRGASPAFGTFKANDTARTPVQILAHLGDLYDWALSLLEGEQRWRDSAPLPWDQEAARFFQALSAFDAFLATDRPLASPAEKVFQGPIADSLTHIGQIALLRRLAGEPIRGENYFVADVAIGKVGADQTPPRREF